MRRLRKGSSLACKTPSSQNGYERLAQSTKIKIILTGKATWSDVEKVKDYLFEIIGTEIEVVRR